MVSCRDLPARVTQGEDRADALAQAADAMDEVFAIYMDDGLPLPPPSKARRGEVRVSAPAETVAKAAARGTEGRTPPDAPDRHGLVRQDLRPPARRRCRVHLVVGSRP